MKIYVTKYLFTEGIQEMEGVSQAYAPGRVEVGGAGPGFLNGSRAFHGDEWHRSREAALAHAEKLRAKKLAALDKQRKKIEAMTFA